MDHYAKEIRAMGVIHVGDLVVNSDPSVIGEVLSTCAGEHGLRRAVELDLWDTGDGLRYADSALVPVRWDAADGSYEWWEDPEFLTVVRPALSPGPVAVH